MAIITIVIVHKWMEIDVASLVVYAVGKATPGSEADGEVAGEAHGNNHLRGFCLGLPVVRRMAETQCANTCLERE